MKLVDLFSGIGGFSLAAHWMGWETIAFCEQDKFCQKVLRKNFDNGIPIYDDIRTFPGESFRGADIVTGGFPCQPFSGAGKKYGKGDERYLFPEMLRVVEEVRPSWVVAENVRGLLGNDYGNIFEEICSSLESIGFAVQPFCIPASAVDAPHRRDRLWFIAHSDRARLAGERGRGTERLERSGNGGQATEAHLSAIKSAVAIPAKDAEGIGCRGRHYGNPTEHFRALQTEGSDSALSWKQGWLPAATELCRMDDGIPNRVDRIKSLGNSIVPQIAYEIFRAIEAADGER